MSEFLLKPIGYTHAELVSRAVTWLRNVKNCRVVLAEQSALCGENADVYLEGVALCQSCANVAMDVEEQWEEQA